MPYPRSSDFAAYTAQRFITSGTLMPLGGCVNTTGSAVAAGVNHSVVVADLTNIVPGKKLRLGNGVGATEIVTVLAINIGTSSFTASFSYAHSSTYNIISINGIMLGPLTVGQQGVAGASIVIYHGHPLDPVYTGVVIANIAPTVGGSFPLGYELTRGAFVTISGTVGDYSFAVADIASV